MYLYQDKQGSFRESSVPCVWMRVSVCVMILFHSRSLNLYMYCICLSFCHFSLLLYAHLTILTISDAWSTLFGNETRSVSLSCNTPLQPNYFLPYTGTQYSHLSQHETLSHVHMDRFYETPNRKCRCSHQDKCRKQDGSPLLHTRAAAVLFIYMFVLSIEIHQQCRRPMDDTQIQCAHIFTSASWHATAWCSVVMHNRSDKKLRPKTTLRLTISTWHSVKEIGDKRTVLEIIMISLLIHQKRITSVLMRTYLHVLFPGKQKKLNLFFQYWSRTIALTGSEHQMCKYSLSRKKALTI